MYVLLWTYGYVAFSFVLSEALWQVMIDSCCIIHFLLRHPACQQDKHHVWPNSELINSPTNLEKEQKVVRLASKLLLKYGTSTFEVWDYCRVCQMKDWDPENTCKI